MDRGVSYAGVSQLELIIQQVCDAANDSTRQGTLGLIKTQLLGGE